jgi:hypothetical protein
MKTIIHYNQEDKTYEIFSLEKGGPIVDDPSLEKAIEKFANAFELFKFVKYILNYENT